MRRLPWASNVAARMQEFVARSGASVEEFQAMRDFARRLAIDPLDVPAKRDHVGEFYAVLRDGRHLGGRTLAVGYLVDASNRTIDVIAFEAYIPQ